VLGQVLLGGTRHDLRINFLFSEHFEGLALGVVVKAGQAKQGGVRGARRGYDLFDQVLVLPHPDDLAGFRDSDGLRHGRISGNHFGG
jgi:hypothetical protein